MSGWEAALIDTGIALAAIVAGFIVFVKVGQRNMTIGGWNESAYDFSKRRAAAAGQPPPPPREEWHDAGRLIEYRIGENATEPHWMKVKDVSFVVWCEPGGLVGWNDSINPREYGPSHASWRVPAEDSRQ